MAATSIWDRVRGGSKKGFDAGWKALDKLGAPTNRLSNKLGSEAFWPTTLDKESEKAARILKSFCKDGFYQDETEITVDGPKQKQKVLKKIPQDVIKNAKGLAIFTTMRTGLWVSGAGGSRILIARQEDGSWSPPSGILLHTAGLGFLVGIDIYDCVVVINSDKALEAFTKIRCTLGSEISVTAGPVGAGGVFETEVHKRQAPIFTYMKSRGFYAGVQIDGTVIIERTDENERFYDHRVPVADILAGKIKSPPTHNYRKLTETLKAAQGDTTFDETALPTEPPPSDYTVETGNVFGIPVKDDPDPYGVLALEKEGLSLREAGSQKRASWQQFAFNPVATSPVHDVYARTSQERSNSSSRTTWRASSVPVDPKMSPTLGTKLSTESTRPTMVDMATQTDMIELPSPTRSVPPGPRSNRTSATSNAHSHMPDVPEYDVLETTIETPSRITPGSTQVNGYTTPPGTPPADFQDAKMDKLTIQDKPLHDPTPKDPVVVQAISSKSPSAPKMVSVSKVRIVNVPKRIAPALPPRNPNRASAINDGSPTPSSRNSTEIDPANIPIGSPLERSQHETEHGLDEVRDKMVDVSLTDDRSTNDDLDDKVSTPQNDSTTNPWSDAIESMDEDIESLRNRETGLTPQAAPSVKVPGGFE